MPYRADHPADGRSIVVRNDIVRTPEAQRLDRPFLLYERIGYAFLLRDLELHPVSS